MSSGCAASAASNKFDLGIGDAAYKQVYCKDAEALYDSVIPITAAGQVAAPIWRAGLALKGKVKKSDSAAAGASGPSPRSCQGKLA